MARYAGVGVHFAATIGLFTFVGYWLDDHFTTGPWLLLIGVFLGFGFGLYSLISKLGPKGTTTTTARSGSRRARPTDPPRGSERDPPQSP